MFNNIVVGILLRIRREITVWDKADYRVPQHIYLTSGSWLLGYIPEGTNKTQMFKLPKKQWSVSRRKFQDLTKKEIVELKLGDI